MNIRHSRLASQRIMFKRLIASVVMTFMFTPFLWLRSQECDFNPDWNSDGIISIVDFVEILSVFGASWPPPTTDICENSVHHMGYNYDIVEVNGRCWFAENIKSQLLNSEYLPVASTSQSGNCSWMNSCIDWPATCGGVTTCATFIPTDTIAELVTNSQYNDPTENYSEIGPWYSVKALTEGNDFCPTGWHIPLYSEWLELNETQYPITSLLNMETGGGFIYDGAIVNVNTSEFYTWGVVTEGHSAYVMALMDGAFQASINSMINATNTTLVNNATSLRCVQDLD